MRGAELVLGCTRALRVVQDRQKEPQKSLTVDFEATRVVIEFETASGVLRATAEDMTAVICPHERPWGISSAVFVNEVNLLRRSQGERLEIRTQGGDVITVDAKRVYVESTSTN